MLRNRNLSHQKEIIMHELVKGYLTLCCCFAAVFLLPGEGLERFCGGNSVYVGVNGLMDTLLYVVVLQLVFCCLRRV